MKILIIGGTGTISGAVTRLLVKLGHDVTLLNRGSVPPNDGVSSIICDINDEVATACAIKNKYYDCVAQFVLFTPDNARRDIRLFDGKCGQYVFISSASAYRKPPQEDIITEDVPLCNPFWEYSQNKADCEKVFFDAYRDTGFPVTVIRPSHTYDERRLPVAIRPKSAGAVLNRIIHGKPLIVHDFGDSLWTLTHSDDFAKGFVGVCSNTSCIGQAYHITSDEVLTWNEIYTIIADAANGIYNPCYIGLDELIRSAPELIGTLKGDKANNTVFDNSKIKAAVPDFCCSIPFAEGAKAAVANIIASGEAFCADEQFDLWSDRLCLSL